MQLVRAQIFLLIPLLSGCALFGGGTETLHRASGYDVKPPATWTAQSTDKESDRAFRTSTGNVVTLTSSCQRNANASLDVLTKHLLLGARNTIYSKKERIFVDGKEGQYSSVRTTLEGNPFYLELFVLPKRACVFDFSLVSNKEIPTTEKTEFLTFLKSFTYASN